MSLDIGTMKVTTRLFNEEFINIAKHLDLSEEVQKLPVQIKSPVRSKKHAHKFDPDAEDERLNRIQMMLNQKIDYSQLTQRVLKSCGQQRSPDAAKTLRYLRSRQGPGAWGKLDSVTRKSLEYGRTGFPKSSLGTARTANQTSNCSPRQNNTTVFSGLSKVPSAGNLSKLKSVVVRQSLQIPRKKDFFPPSNTLREVDDI